MRFNRHRLDLLDLSFAIIEKYETQLRKSIKLKSMIRMLYYFIDFDFILLCC